MKPVFRCTRISLREATYPDSVWRDNQHSCNGRNVYRLRNLQLAGDLDSTHVRRRTSNNMSRLSLNRSVLALRRATMKVKPGNAIRALASQSAVEEALGPLRASSRSNRGTVIAASRFGWSSLRPIKCSDGVSTSREVTNLAFLSKLLSLAE